MLRFIAYQFIFSCDNACLNKVEEIYDFCTVVKLVIYNNSDTSLSKYNYNNDNSSNQKFKEKLNYTCHAWMYIHVYIA